MKIAVLFSNYMYSYIKEFMDLCIINGVEVDFFKFANDKISFKVNAKNIYELNSVWNGRNFASIKDVEKEIQSLVNVYDYDYFLSDTMALSFLNACNFFHGHSTKYKYEHISKGLMQKIYLKGHKDIINFEAQHYKNNILCIVGSKEMKYDFMNNCNVPEERIHIFHPGKDNVYTKNIEHKNQDETFTVGIITCGFLLKGGYNVLKAVKKLKKEFTHKQIHFKFIHPNFDKQWYLKLYIKFLGISKYVEFLPFQKNINNFYASIDCLVCASHAEAFGRVVTEAMMFGIPVVVGSNVGASDIIENEVNGYVYKYANNERTTVKNLAKSIKKAYENRENQAELIKKAQKTANSISWFHFTNELFKLLRR